MKTSIVHVALSKERNGLIPGIDLLVGSGRSSYPHCKTPSENEIGEAI